MSKIALKKDDEIQQRQVGDEVPDLFTADPSLGQYNFGDLTQFVEFAKVMSQAGEMLPSHAQRNPAICLALTMRAVHWGFDPFALAQESFQAKTGGPVGYMAKVFTAVMRKSGVRLNYRYEGEVTILDKPVKSHRGNEVAKRTATGDRKCIAYLEEGGQVLEYETPTLDQITIKNSPLWHNDPDQQLAYYAGRGWARRHRADLMMGAYSEDEVKDMRGMRDVTPEPSGFAKLGHDARSKPATDEKAADNTQSPTDEGNEAHTSISGDQSPDPDTSTTTDTDGPEVDPDSPAYGMGAEAASEGFIDRDSGPFQSNPESAVEHANWLAGYDSMKGQSDDQEAS